MGGLILFKDVWFLVGVLALLGWGVWVFNNAQTKTPLPVLESCIDDVRRANRLESVIIFRIRSTCDGETDLAFEDNSCLYNRETEGKARRKCEGTYACLLRSLTKRRAKYPSIIQAKRDAEKEYLLEEAELRRRARENPEQGRNLLEVDPGMVRISTSFLDGSRQSGLKYSLNEKGRNLLQAALSEAAMDPEKQTIFMRANTCSRGIL